ncbi:MAG: hypothetical protein HYZ44_06320 [Bacteroidetes bacterium]|nr:hypothetical protein [Bacteroidota bacterium]
MKAKLVVCLLLFVVVHASHSYPITPRSLMKLIQESEYIITAYVRDVHEIKPKEEITKGKKKKRSKYEYRFGGYQAELVIRKTLQGKVTDSVIFIDFNPHMICPAPPMFFKGSYVLVFLNQKNDSFYVQALSYGVKTLMPGDLEIYCQRIAEMQKILSVADIDQKFMQTTEWLVKCAELRCTRGEGLYELSRKSNFMSFYDGTENQPFEYALSTEQKDRLYEALITTDSLSYEDVGLVDLVYSSHPEKVYNFLLDRIKQVKDTQYWYADDFMSRLNLYKSNERTVALIKQYEEEKYKFDKTEDTDKKLKDILSNFVLEMEKL